MSDLLERLLKCADDGPGAKFGERHGSPICAEAASEIQRMRDLLDDADEGYAILNAELNATKAELASAREEIAGLRAQRAWRPMAEAPRDKTQIIVVFPKGSREIIFGHTLDTHLYKVEPPIGFLPLPPPPEGTMP